MKKTIVVYFLKFCRNRSFQPNKPYIHFVALETTNPLSYKVSDYLMGYES